MIPDTSEYCIKHEYSRLERGSRGTNRKLANRSTDFTVNLKELLHNFTTFEKHRSNAKFETAATMWPKNLLRNQLTRQAPVKDPQIGFLVGGEFAQKIDKTSHLPSFEAVNFVCTLPWSAGSSWLETQ